MEMKRNTMATVPRLGIDADPEPAQTGHSVGKVNFEVFFELASSAARS